MVSGVKCAWLCGKVVGAASQRKGRRGVEACVRFDLPRPRPSGEAS